MIEGSDMQHVRAFAPDFAGVLDQVVADDCNLVRMEDRWDTFSSGPPLFRA